MTFSRRRKLRELPINSLIPNMLTTLVNHEQFLEERGLKALAQTGYSDDPFCQFHAALCYRKLAPNVASHAGIINEGGVPPLIKLSKSAAMEVRLEAAVAMRDLAADPEHKLMFAEEGGAVALIDAVSDNDERIAGLALAGLRHLALNKELKGTIVDCNGLTPIFARCNSNVPEIQIQGAGLLANLSERVRNQSIMARHELGFQSLIALSRSEQQQVQEDCARAYAHLSSNPENQVNIFTTDVYRSLFFLLESPVCNTARFAAMATGNLAVVVVNQIQMVQNNVLPRLINLLDSEFMDCQHYAARALYRLAANSGKDRKSVV